MIKMFFPYNDQPKKFSFDFKEAIRFPFYVNDLVYFWEVDARGITLYLKNNTADTIKDIRIEDAGIVVYLHGNRTQVDKHIIVDCAKIGSGLYELGVLDPITIGDIDALTLGYISTYAADWMELKHSIDLYGVVHSEASHTEMQIESDSVASCSKSIIISEISNDFGLTGLNNQKILTIGDLDPKILNDIDAMMSTFRMLDPIPAYLVKEIRITHDYTISNEDASLSLYKDINGSNIVMKLGELNDEHSDDEESVVQCIAQKVLQFSMNYIGAINSSLSLVVSVDETNLES